MPRLKKKSDDVRRRVRKKLMTNHRSTTEISTNSDSCISENSNRANSTCSSTLVENSNNKQSSLSNDNQQGFKKTSFICVEKSLDDIDINEDTSCQSNKVDQNDGDQLMSRIESYFSFQRNENEKLSQNIELCSSKSERKHYWQTYKQGKRQDATFREKEKLKETLSKRTKRLSLDYKISQNQKETKLKNTKRLNPEYRQTKKEVVSKQKQRLDAKFNLIQNQKETKLKNTKRLNPEYRQTKKEVVSKQQKRLDPKFNLLQNQQETKLKKTKRLSSDYKLSQNKKETKLKKTKRLSLDYKISQNQRETKLKNTKRLNPEYRQTKKEVVSKQKQRLDPKFNLLQNQKETELKRTKRKRLDYKNDEKQRETPSKKRRRNEIKNMEIDELIIQFHKKTSSGPTCICECCNQLWYKHSVMKSTSLKEFNKAANQCLLENGEGWICGTCKKYIKKDLIPPLSIYNGNSFPELPDHLDLHPLEWRLLSPRIPFMKIYAAPRGKQRKIRGNVVNVPANVVNTISSLPRAPDENLTIAANLKRQLKYNHAVMTENIRPYKIKQCASWLEENGDLYKKEGISFDEDWSVDSFQVNGQTENQQENQPEYTNQPVNTNQPEYTNQPEESVNISDNDEEKSGKVDSQNQKNDDWSEDEGDEIPGSKDTLLSSPDFIETDEKDKVHNFAPGQGNIPLSIFMDKNSEELAFPNIFCGKARTNSDSRKTNVYYSELCKSELRRSDRRVANCVDNVFFKLKKIQMKTIIGQTQIAVRKNKTGGNKITAGDLKTPGHVNKLIQYDEGYMVLKTLRGSPPYFKIAKTDLFAMIRQLGPATYFGSFSAAETKWAHLLKILGKLQDNHEYDDDEIENMDWETKCRLIASDPVTCVRQFDYQVNLLFRDILKQEGSPLGKVVDYFYRVEFQHRGSPHIHTLLWIDDAPVFGENSVDEITKFIDKSISCKRFVEDDMLQDLVNYQIHKHSHTCKKKHRHVCRFGFPKPPMPNTVILEPLDTTMLEVEVKLHSTNFDKINVILNEMLEGEDISFDVFLKKIDFTFEQYNLAVRSSIRSPTVFLQRSPNELRVNSYNPHLLKAWRANIDIQFVLDVYACAMYIASYIAKSQRGMSDLLRNACQEVRNGNHGIREQVKMIGNKFLNNVEISAQEAVYIILQLPMRKASKQVVFINTSPPEERVCLLKTQQQIDDLEDEDENIQSSNLIDRYKKRPKALENVSLADFVSWYDHKKSYTKRSKIVQSDETLLENQQEHNSDEEDIELDNKVSKKRAIPRVIRYVNFNIDKEPEKHYRELLMLFTNWRVEEIDLIANCDSFQQKFDQLSDQIQIQRKQYESNREAVDAAVAAEVQDLEEAWDEQAPVTQQIQQEDQQEENDNTQLMSKSGEPTKYEYDIGVDLGIPSNNQTNEIALYEMPDEEYRALMRLLNKKQLHFVYDSLHMIKSTNTQVFRFLSGGAGVGKSFVTSALYQSLLRYFKTKAGDDFQTTRQLLLAPTGKAAYNIKGNTIHSALLIPVSQSLQYKALDSSRLNTLRSTLGGLKVVFIDEISMVGNGMLNFINRRLQDIKGSPLLFGGVHVIAVGDLFQLKPVFDGYVFENSQNAYGPLASNLWQDNFVMYELTEIMRQKDSKIFAELLNRFREGCYTSDKERSDDLALLKTRLLTTNNGSDYPYDIQHLFLTNEKMQNFNNKVFENMLGQKYVIKAKDSVVGSAAQALAKTLLQNIPQDPRKTMQLSTNLYLVEGMKCEICLNARIDDGLTNGSACTIRCIQISQSNSAVGSLVWVEFEDNKVGQLTRKEYKALYNSNINKSWTPILPISRQFRVGRFKNAEVMRTQVPLRPSAAKTIHRSQGDTLDKVVVDFEGRKTPHIHYVGLSRVKTIEGLHIINLNENKIKVSAEVKTEMQDLRSVRKLKFKTKDLYSNSLNFVLLYHNVRSLQKYIKDVKCNQIVTNGSVIILTETRLKVGTNTNIYDIPGFTLYRNDIYTEKQKNHHGIAVYINDSLLDSCVTVEPHNKNKVEMSLVKLQIQIDGQSKRCNILGVYKPPKVTETDLCIALDSVKETIGNDELMVILGDFNQNEVKSKSLNGMCQLINEATTDSGSIIDLIYTNIPQAYIESGTQENYYSDHKIVYLIVNNNQIEEEIPDSTSCSERVYPSLPKTNTSFTSKKSKLLCTKKHKTETRTTTTLPLVPTDIVVARQFGFSIMQIDLSTLNHGQWLNDQIINFHMKFLEDRENKLQNSVLALDVFCYKRLESNIANAVSCYEGKNIFQNEKVLIPVHISHHWSLIVVFVQSKTIKYYDSISHNQRGFVAMNNILRFISQLEKSSMTNWKQIIENNIVIQNNGYDCGVHVCINADLILQEKSLIIPRKQVNEYRQKIKQNILKYSV